MDLIDSDKMHSVYVSLGDSMSIDDYAGGEGCGAASLLFKNRASDFPEWNGRDFSSRHPDALFLALARDGATSEAVRYLQVAKLAEQSGRIELVTVTMGGNDLLQSYGDDASARLACQRLSNNGDALLGELRKIVGKSCPVLISTIYDPSDGTGDTAALNIAPWPSVLAWIDAYNNILRRLAADYDAILVDVRAAFQGHGLNAGDPSSSEARPQNHDLYYCGVVEPNAWGASALRALWWNSLGIRPLK